jgi:N-acyl-D-amino-acid deacylase
MLDILIQNGWVADGTGNPTYPANIAIQGDRIVEVGRLEGAEAGRVIDATGKIVCPGFVDTHSHSDRTILANPTAQSTIRQGVTTEIVGHCGHSHAPIVTTGAGSASAHNLREMGFEGEVAWSTFAEYLDHVQRMGTSCNLGWMVGHNTVRFAAGLTGPEYSAEQMRAMQAHVREAMEAGAMGISTGLEFEPGRRATTKEVVRVAQVVGEVDGYHASHIRNRAVHFQEAIDEFIEITRRSGTRGQVAHLNVRYNTGEKEDTWQQAVDTLVRARLEGLDVAADCTPYQDGEGLPRAILPDWVMADGPARAAQYLSDPETRMQLRTQCDRYWSFIHRGDFDRVTISRSDRHPELMGKNLVEIGELWGKHPWDVLFDLLVLAFRGEDRIAYVGRLFTEAHVIAQITHPLINLGVDAVTSATEGPLSKTYMHPLPYAGMIHYLTYWVRQKKALSLEEAIRKMTSMGATRFGLRDRGQLRGGAYADVVVFDYQALDDGATPEQPVAYCKGVEYVLVNGVPVIDGGEHTGARPGRTVHYS